MVFFLAFLGSWKSYAQYPSESIHAAALQGNIEQIKEFLTTGADLDKKTHQQSVMKSFTSTLVNLAIKQKCPKTMDQKMLEFFPELADQINE